MDDLKQYDAVQMWISSARLADEPRSLRELGDFCTLVERNPDEMVEDCLRLISEGQFRLKGRTRRRYVERIDEFERDRGGRAHGNQIRSFFIHNGVPIQPPIIA